METAETAESVLVEVIESTDRRLALLHADMTKLIVQVAECRARIDEVETQRGSAVRMLEHLREK